MLIDRAVVEVRSGKGGNGAISFLQERCMPKGGPDGGNGGKGGSVYLVAKRNVNTLLAFRHSKVIEAKDGEKGDKKLRYGRAADDVFVEVPVGTVVTLESDGSFIADLKHEDDMVRVAKGGRGGRGNAAFKSSRNRIPRVAENGLPGERKRIILELKLVADAGIIGLPSVGKSTLLNIVTRANVETADYPFTTVVPNLGVVTLKDGNQFVLADMPGLIEGAHEGRGLGITFLRHIERCRVLLHVVSMDGERDPYEDYVAINEELKLYGNDLEKRPQIVVCSKMDSDNAEELKAEFEKKAKVKTIGISALTDQGVELLMKKTYELIQKTPEFKLFKEEEEGGMRVYDAHKDKKEEIFVVSKPSDHLWVIDGDRLMRTYAIINLSTDEGVAKFLAYLDKIGLEDELRKRGAETGDTVRIADFEFEYSE
ncbi:MAG: GTPase ObgE [Bacilli bacterium]|nr:GTPase ObgE [Bacilli bacterium]